MTGEEKGLEAVEKLRLGVPFGILRKSSVRDNDFKEEEFLQLAL